MTIHPVRMTGLVLGVPQTLSYFDKMQERIINFVSQNSKIKPDRFRELMLKTGELVMDVGTVLDGVSAVDEGLIDSVGNLKDAMSYLYNKIDNK
jgi:ATP-dependent protease ClpP protease subunit